MYYLNILYNIKDGVIMVFEMPIDKVPNSLGTFGDYGGINRFGNNHGMNCFLALFQVKKLHLRKEGGRGQKNLLENAAYLNR